jgi:hypothetical protein
VSLVGLATLAMRIVGVQRRILQAAGGIYVARFADLLEQHVVTGAPVETVGLVDRAGRAVGLAGLAAGRIVDDAPGAEAVAALVRWTTSASTPGIAVPHVWPGLRDGRFALGLVPAAAKAPLPGVLAHQYFGHADGSMLVLYAWLRLEAGLAPDVAFEEAVKRTTGVRRADVRDLLPTPAVA